MLGLGVSDGVYMWRNRGIDAGVFSRSLMLSAKNAVEYGQSDVLNGAVLSAMLPLAKRSENHENIENCAVSGTR